MAVPKHFSIFRTAAEEAAEMKGSDAWENESGQAASDPEAAIHELIFALYAEDVRLGIVREADVLDDGGGFSLTGGAHYHRRAVAILDTLSQVSDTEIIAACAAEESGTPRGAAARVELHRRGLRRS
jgi:hypothetical protein